MMKEMYKKSLRAMIPFLLLVGMTACRAVTPEEQQAAEAEELKKMCAEVLNAIGENDYPAFRKICGDLIPEKEFRAAHNNMKQQFGELTDFRHMTSLRTPMVQNDVWVVTFNRKSTNGEAEVTQDLLFRFVTGEDADGWKVIGFAFL